MLDIPMIQAAAKTSEATARTAGRSNDDDRTRDARTDGFEAEYSAEQEQRADTSSSAGSERATSKADSQNSKAEVQNQSDKSPEITDAEPSSDTPNMEGISTFEHSTLTDGEVTDQFETNNIAPSATLLDGKAASMVGKFSDVSYVQPTISTAEPKATLENVASARHKPDPATAQTMASALPETVKGPRSTAETVITSKATALSQKDVSHAAPADPAQTTQRFERAVNLGNPGAVQAVSTAFAPTNHSGQASSDNDLIITDLQRNHPPQPSSQAAMHTAVGSAAKPTVAGSQAAVELKLTVHKDKVDLSPVISGDLETMALWEPRAGTTSATGSLAQVLARADTPAAIGRQMVEALQKLPDRPVEVSLNPRELGRVRMSIAAAESGITVSVVVERPETLDLMRRNIDHLAREFQSIGYENINFSFAEGHSRENRQTETRFDNRVASTSIDLEHAETTVAVPQPKDIITTGLDLRL